MGYDWDFRFLVGYTRAFAWGAWVTLWLSGVSFLIGTTVGIPAGWLLRLKGLKYPLLLVNDAIRAVPTLVMLLLVYYFPVQQVFGLSPISAAACTVIGMSITQAAYTADLVRAAVDNVSPRALLGGRAIGLNERDVWRFLIVPDILRQMLPTQIAFLIGIIRLTSIASVIGAEETVYVAKVAISQNFRSIEAWIVVAAIYIVLVLPLTWCGRMLERSKWLKRRF